MRRVALLAIVLAIAAAARADAHATPTVRISSTSPMSVAEDCGTEPTTQCAGSPLLDPDTPTNQSQTIHVGEQPVPLVLGTDVSGVDIVLGALPDGLTLNPDGTWGGAANETGTFTVRLCAADPVCAAHGPADFSLTVTRGALARTGASSDWLLSILGVVLIAAGIALRRLAVRRLP